MTASSDFAWLHVTSASRHYTVWWHRSVFGYSRRVCNATKWPRWMSCCHRTLSIPLPAVVCPLATALPAHSYEIEHTRDVVHWSQETWHLVLAASITRALLGTPISHLVSHWLRFVSPARCPDSVLGFWSTHQLHPLLSAAWVPFCSYLCWVKSAF